VTRRMSDPAYRQEQLKDLYAAHVKPINKLVDELRVDPQRWMPHVAPLHGGTESRLLLLVSDPGAGPAVDRPHDHLLGVEADDARSARLGALLRTAGIEAQDTLVWCAFPWYTRHSPSTSDISDGVEPLHRLVELVERLEIVVLLGPAAKRSWRSLTSTHPYDVPDVPVLTTRDTDDEAFAGSNAQRRQWREEQEQVFVEAAALLHGG
jgi:hypothetical protein